MKKKKIIYACMNNLYVYQLYVYIHLELLIIAGVGAGGNSLL